MSNLEKFMEYAMAFEQTFEDQDWSRLEAFFTEDAVYEISGGAPFGGKHKGRAAVIEHMRTSCDGFDRLFDKRSVSPTGPPSAEGDSVLVEWEATYASEGKPELKIRGSEQLIYRDGKIARMVDAMETGTDERCQAYAAEHFGVTFQPV